MGVDQEVHSGTTARAIDARTASINMKSMPVSAYRLVEMST